SHLTVNNRTGARDQPLSTGSGGPSAGNPEGAARHGRGHARGELRGVARVEERIQGLSPLSAPRRGPPMSYVITLLAATFLMGSGFVAGKILITEGFPPMMLVGWRFLVAALATLPLVAICEQRVTTALVPAHLRLRDAALIVVIGLFQTAGVMCLLFYAMRFVSASIAAILLFTNPIWVALLGRLFLGESRHRAKNITLTLGIAGVALAIG